MVDSAPLANPQSPANVGDTFGGKYFIRRRIGDGGMGTVYEAEHLHTKRVGALKLLHAGVAVRPHAAQRFLAEASAAGRIGNPHIVETIDAGELPSGEPYLFMELLRGETLRERLEREGPLPLAVACAVVLQAADGLGAAHAAGIVHRDVKPENLFLETGDPPHVKLIDFGIAKFASAGDLRRTADGAPIGTPYYMAPEQVTGTASVDGRSDVYALGVVLYECLTGRVPFDAGTLAALSLAILAGDYEPASAHLEQAPPDLDAVLGRALAVEPSGRYPSMLEFGAALARVSPAAPATRAEFGATIDAARAAPVDVARGKWTTRTSTRAAASLVALAFAAAAASLALRPKARTGPGSPSAAATPSAAPSSNPHGGAAPSNATVVPAASVARTPPAPPSATSAPRPAPRLRGQPSARPLSRAARDGLLEQNPFAE